MQGHCCRVHRVRHRSVPRAGYRLTPVGTQRRSGCAMAWQRAGHSERVPALCCADYAEPFPAASIRLSVGCGVASTRADGKAVPVLDQQVQHLVELFWLWSTCCDHVR